MASTAEGRLTLAKQSLEHHYEDGSRKILLVEGNLEKFKRSFEKAKTYFKRTEQKLKEAEDNLTETKKKLVKTENNFGGHSYPYATGDR